MMKNSFTRECYLSAFLSGVFVPFGHVGFTTPPRKPKNVEM